VKPERAYIYSFYFGFTIQLVLLLIVPVALYAALVISLLNMLATMFTYPWFFVWLSKGEWSRIPPILGPHQ